MKKMLLTGALTLTIWIASETMAGAQVYVESRSHSNHRSLRVTYSSGYGFGYTPWVWGSSPVVLTTYRPVPYYRVPYYPYYAGTRVIYNYAPVYATLPESAERANRLRMQEEVGAGIRRFQRADYRGAVESFRRGFLASTDSGLLELYLGLALVGTGDLRNAEKAMRSAFESLKPEDALGIDLPILFQDAAEESRFVAANSPLIAGVVQFLLNRGDAAREELRKVPKDPAARKLLDRLSK